MKGYNLETMSQLPIYTSPTLLRSMMDCKAMRKIEILLKADLIKSVMFTKNMSLIVENHTTVLLEVLEPSALICTLCRPSDQVLVLSLRILTITFVRIFLMKSSVSNYNDQLFNCQQKLKVIVIQVSDSMWTETILNIAFPSYHGISTRSMNFRPQESWRWNIFVQNRRKIFWLQCGHCCEHKYYRY